MSKKQFLLLKPAVYLILIKRNKIHLLRRFNTGWQDGKYSLISGHVHKYESLVKAMAREAKEEAGIYLRPENLRIAHTMYRKSNYEHEYIDFFLATDDWKGEPKITEPDKCDDMGWFPLNDLPQNLLPHVRKAIENYLSRVPFSEFS